MLPRIMNAESTVTEPTPPMISTAREGGVEDRQKLTILAFGIVSPPGGDIEKVVQ